MRLYFLEGETKDDVSSAGSICTYGSPTKGSWRMKDFGSLTLMVGGVLRCRR